MNNDNRFIDIDFNYDLNTRDIGFTNDEGSGLTNIINIDYDFTIHDTDNELLNDNFDFDFDIDFNIIIHDIDNGFFSDNFNFDFNIGFNIITNIDIIIIFNDLITFKIQELR